MSIVEYSDRTRVITETTETLLILVLTSVDMVKISIGMYSIIGHQ